LFSLGFRGLNEWIFDQDITLKKSEHRIGPHLGEISDFNREVDKNCAPLGCYSSSGVQKSILDPLEDEADMLSRNVGKELPLLAA
jgi:hypothetical protein